MFSTIFRVIWRKFGLLFGQCIPSVAAYQIFQQGPEGPKKAWVSIFRSICTRGSKKWLSGKTPMVRKGETVASQYKQKKVGQTDRQTV